MLLIGIVFISSILIFALSLRIAERDVPAVLTRLDPTSDPFSNNIDSF